nr:hypothetical protein [Tanacetum cinerariifolium]
WGKGVKEKSIDGNKTNISGIGLFTASDGTLNEVTPVPVKEGVTSSVVDITVEMEKISSLEDTTIWDLFHHYLRRLLLRLVIPLGNGIDVVVPVEYIRPISERFANTTYGFFFGKWVAYLVVANYLHGGLDAMLENGPWFIWNNPLILKKWHLDKNLLKEDVSTVSVWLKLHGALVTAFSEDGLSAIATKLGTSLMLDSYTSDMYMQSWGRSSYARPMIELRIDELKDNISTLIINKTGKFEELLTSGKAILVDEAGNPLKKVEYPGDYDSEDELASVDYDMARSMASERVGFGTQSLLEQWRDSYGNGKYDEDPYDDDMYEGQDLPQELQAICDNLDIRV